MLISMLVFLGALGLDYLLVPLSHYRFVDYIVKTRYTV